MTSMNKFCKVCKDMGKPESVWKSHYVRQTRHPDSPVTCPTILNNVCKYCNIKGHSISSCIKKKKDLKEAKQQEFQEKKRVVVVQCDAPIVKTQNAFAVLDDDSDSECDEVKPVVVSRKRPLNWASMDSDSESDEK